MYVVIEVKRAILGAGAHKQSCSYAALIPTAFRRPWRRSPQPIPAPRHPTSPYLLLPVSAQQLLLPSASFRGLSVNVGGPRWGRHLAASQDRHGRGCAHHERAVSLHIQWVTKRWASRPLHPDNGLSQALRLLPLSLHSPSWVGMAGHEERFISLPPTGTWCCGVLVEGTGSSVDGRLWAHQITGHLWASTQWVFSCPELNSK